MKISTVQKSGTSLTKLDLKAQLGPLYRASSSEPQPVSVGNLSYLMIDGKGDPNASPDFQNGIEALFTLSYHLKFAVKKRLGVDYAVMPLEGLWWAEDMTRFSTERKGDWRWTLMILQPSLVEAGAVEESRAAVGKKKSLPALSKIRYESYLEGDCAQILHVGPFSEEGPTLEKLHQWIAAAGRVRTGKHHEIYLSDFRRTAPPKLKTLLRQPFR